MVRPSKTFEWITHQLAGLIKEHTPCLDLQPLLCFNPFFACYLSLSLCYDLVRGLKCPVSEACSAQLYLNPLVTCARGGMTPYPAIYILRQEHPFNRTPEPSSSPRTGFNSLYPFFQIYKLLYFLCSLLISLNKFTSIFEPFPLCFDQPNPPLSTFGWPHDILVMGIPPVDGPERLFQSSWSCSNSKNKFRLRSYACMDERRDKANLSYSTILGIMDTQITGFPVSISIGFFLGEFCVFTESSGQTGNTGSFHDSMSTALLERLPFSHPTPLPHIIINHFGGHVSEENDSRSKAILIFFPFGFYLFLNSATTLFYYEISSLISLEICLDSHHPFLPLDHQPRIKWMGQMTGIKSACKNVSMETIRLTGLGAVQIKQDKLTQLIGLLECEEKALYKQIMNRAWSMVEIPTRDFHFEYAKLTNYSDENLNSRGFDWSGNIMIEGEFRNARELLVSNVKMCVLIADRSPRWWGCHLQIGRFTDEAEPPGELFTCAAVAVTAAGTSETRSQGISFFSFRFFFKKILQLKLVDHFAALPVPLKSLYCSFPYDLNHIHIEHCPPSLSYLLCTTSLDSLCYPLSHPFQSATYLPAIRIIPHTIVYGANISLPLWLPKPSTTID
ncbi:hypothetical protein VP01_676g2 [Puccinia sorghi]|uniref:Uncharacterized protein n=1 Tax=Puccinia sorghi TaxID=27349 RepID=A0A0L6UGS5_9BASI|nr:hypothetical protein VP01_676g2 [Puccinia sorghi]